MVELESFYHGLPAAIQNCLCTAEGWRVRLQRYGGRYRSIARNVFERGAWGDAELAAFRAERLALFVAAAAASVPHYRRVFARLGLTPGCMALPGDLAVLPVLDKAEVQDCVADFRSPASGHSVVTAHTSGTTGAGLRFATTREAVQEQWAVWWRYRSWHGLKPGLWCAYFGGRSIVGVDVAREPFWRVNYADRQILFSGYHMSPQHLPAYVAELRRCRPPWFHGYPSLLSLLASHVLDSGETLGFCPRWVTTGAENLLPQQAEVVERAFGVKPRQHYGMAEAVANASECTHGLLHIDEDFAFVELIPFGNGCYRVIGTNLSNPLTPLIRYDTGDIVVCGPSPCPCGRPGRTLHRVDGRQEDYITKPDGTRIGRLDHVFKDMVNVKEAQLQQASDGAVTVLLVRGQGFSADDEVALRRQLCLRLGDVLPVRFEYCERIPRTKAGKLRFVVSSVTAAARTGTT